MAKQSPRVAERRSMAGKNPSARQVETSMSKKYKGTPKVSQGTIDRIKGMGMTSALKKASSSKNPEFIEGLRRMYGAKRVNQAMKPVKKAAPAMGPKSPRVAEMSRPGIKKQSPRVSERSAAKKAPAKKTPSGYTPSPQMQAKREQAARGRSRVKAVRDWLGSPVGGGAKSKSKTSAPKPFAPGGRSR